MKITRGEYIDDLAGSPLSRDKFDAILKGQNISYEIGEYDDYSYAVLNGFKGSRKEFDAQKESKYITKILGGSDKKIKELQSKIDELNSVQSDLEKLPNKVLQAVNAEVKSIRSDQKEYNNKTIQNLGKKADKAHKHRANEIIGLETIVKGIEDKIDDRPTRDEVSEVLDKKFITKDNTYTKEETRKVVDDKLKKIVVPGNGGGSTDLSGLVAKSDYTPAHSLLVQQSGTGSPSSLQVGVNTVVGRLSGGSSEIDDIPMSDLPVSTATQTALDLKLDKTYITATPSISSVETESKGGLLLCIDPATGDVAQTSNGWIEDQKYGMYLQAVSSAMSAEFDTAVRRTGNKTLKLSTTNTTGRGTVNHYGIFGTGDWAKGIIPVKASTKYKLECYVKTNNVATNGVYMVVYNMAGQTLGASVDSNKVSGTSDWTLLTVTFTTAGSTDGIIFQLRNYVTGNVSDAWFDVNSMKLTQLNESTNAGQQSDQPVIGAIVAKSETRVDQSQETHAASGTINPAQSFIPTKSRFYSFSFLKASGTVSGDITCKIIADNGGTPVGGTVMNTTTYTAAAWNALANFNYANVVIPCTLTPGNTYWMCMYTSGGMTVATSTTNVYTSGLLGQYDGTTFTAFFAGGRDMRFITYYTANINSAGASAHGKKMEIKASSSAGFVDGAMWDVDNGKFIYNPTVTVANLPQVAHSDNGTDLVIKFDTGVPVSNIIANSGKTLQYSTDGSTFTSAIPTDVSVFYIKILSYSGIVTFNVSADLDMSTITVPRCYPTGVVFTKAYKLQATQNYTSIVYRANKYQNKDGLVFPALEFGNTHEPLEIDTRDASTISYTIYNSAGVSVYTGAITADGQSISVASDDIYFIALDVTLSKNTTRTWVNDYYADSARDGSNSATFRLTKKSQGLERDLKDIQAQIDEIKRSL